MSDLRQAAQQALEALEGKRYTACGWKSDCDKAIATLRAALADHDRAWYTIDEINAKFDPKPVQQGCAHCNHPLYAATKCRVCGRVTEPTPPQRKPLSEVDLRALYDRHAACQEEGPEISGWWDFARAIERAHKIGGEG